MRIRNSIGKLFFSSTDRVKKSTLTLFVSPNIWQKLVLQIKTSPNIHQCIFVIIKTSYVRFGPKLSHKNGSISFFSFQIDFSENVYDGFIKNVLLPLNFSLATNTLNLKVQFWFLVCIIINQLLRRAMVW